MKSFFCKCCYIFLLLLHCHSLGDSSPNAKMSPVKSKGKVNAKLQKAEPPKKEPRVENSRQNISKIESTRKVPKGKPKQKGSSPTLEISSNTINRKEKVKADQNKDMDKSAGIKERHKLDKNKLGKGRPADLKPKTDVEATNSTKKTTRPTAPKDSPSTVSTRPKNKRDSNVTESEEESESSAGSSAEVTDEKLSDDEKEEEQGSSEEAAETQASEQSSEEETEASDTQRYTEHSRNKGTYEEFFETSRSDSEVKSRSSSKEDEEDNGREAEAPEAVISDGSEDQEISREELHVRPLAEKNSKRPKQASRPPKVAEKSTFKMFRKTKAEKQVEKAEKQKAKDEKKRIRKEAKQRAKEEKKNKNKSQKPVSSTEETQQPNCASMSKEEASKGEIKHSNKAKILQESDEPIDVETTDPDEDEEEEVKDRPTLTKAISGQNRIMLLKNKGKDLKPLLEREKQQETGAAIKAHQQKPLLGKVKMASLRNKANKILVRPDEETSEVGTLDEETSKGREHLIGRRKSITTLRRVSGWIQKKVPRGLNLKKKLSAWTKAIGISHWLSTRTIKQKQCPKKSKGNILKSRMAMRVASKNSLLSKTNENKMPKEKTWTMGKAGDEGEGVPTEEKDGEAKYAVVLPRMNRLGQPKTAEVSQAGHGSSTSSSTNGSPGEPTTSGPKPPKPGAKLVLPVKPDLSLLKSIKNPLSGGLTTGRDVTDKSPHSIGTLEASSNIEDINRRSESENQSAVSILQATRAKLDPSQINLSKISFSGGPNRATGQDPEREPPVGISRSTAQSCADAKPITEITGVRSLYEEETDREVAQLMGGEDIYGLGQTGIHWTGNPRMSGDPQVCAISLMPTRKTRNYTII